MIHNTARAEPTLDKYFKKGPTGSSLKCPLPSKTEPSLPCISLFLPSPKEAQLRYTKTFWAHARDRVRFWVCHRDELNQPISNLLAQARSNLSQLGTLWTHLHVCFQHGISVLQCGMNIQIFKYIQICLVKYIHLSKYWLIFSKANIFGYSFVIYLYWQIY